MPYLVDLIWGGANGGWKQLAQELNPGVLQWEWGRATELILQPVELRGLNFTQTSSAVSNAAVPSQLNWRCLKTCPKHLKSTKKFRQRAQWESTEVSRFGLGSVAAPWTYHAKFGASVREKETFDEAFLLQRPHGRPSVDELHQPVLHAVLVAAVRGAVLQLGAAEHVCGETLKLPFIVNSARLFPILRRLLTEGASVGLVARLGVWGGGDVSRQGAVSGQVLGAVWPPQRKTSGRFSLNTQRSELGPGRISFH